MLWKRCVPTSVPRRKMCTATGASVNCSSSLSWKNCQCSFCVATDKVIKAHNRHFLRFHGRLAPLSQRQRSASVQWRVITTATLPPILQEAGMMIIPWHKDPQARPLPKFPACWQKPDAFRPSMNPFRCLPPRLRALWFPWPVSPIKRYWFDVTTNSCFVGDNFCQSIITLSGSPLKSIPSPMFGGAVDP